jgi:cytochrome c oxidase assembly factor CtaG
VTLALLVAALVYARGWYRLRTARANEIPVWRLVGFMCGLSAAWIAVASPLAMLHHASLTMHMTQHLLLMAAAAPLLLLGAPALPLRWGLPARARRASDPALGNRFVRALGRALTHPALCWLVAPAAVIGWHVPGAFALGMQSHGWHAAQHGSFFAAGLLFWCPVIQPWPSIARWPAWSVPAYLFAATLPCDALSAFLVFCDRVVYPCYESGPLLFGMSPLQDQASAGALMWVCVTLVYLIPAVVVTMRLLSPRPAGAGAFNGANWRPVAPRFEHGFEVERI